MTNFQVFVELSKALAAPIVAMGAVAVSLLQFKIAKTKLKLDLYDRRIKVYEGVMETVEDALTDLNAGVGVLIRLNRVSAEADFLFKDDVSSYLDSLKRTMRETVSISNRINAANNGGPPVPPDAVHKQMLAFERLSIEHNKAKTIFGKYLRLA
ncbi:hypothetical protein [Xanthomonas cannabis]|uniref:hypothetical protein n=1 Tax=Xanthomonas cannabis TaxID=1885674 RepID=UPI0011120A6B|nr:hypothetical protein [Xanthomonas cannabis]